MTQDHKAHSPLPWRVMDGEHFAYPGIESNGGCSVAVIGEASEDCGIQGDTPEEASANAALIVERVNGWDALQSRALAAEAGTVRLREALEPRVWFNNDEIGIEWKSHDKHIVISFSDDGFGYALRSGDKFLPGKYNNIAEAITEIRAALAKPEGV